MKIEINGQQYTVPTGLSQITLRQRIEFDASYVQEMKEALEYIDTIEDETERELELMIYRVDIACKALSFYAGIPLKVVKRTDISKVLSIYDACFGQLFNELDGVELQREHLWEDKIWVLEAPELTYSSDITFNEFVVSKQAIKAVADLGNGIWDGVPYLAAVYLRLENEKFDEGFVSEGSDRLQKMQDLPMDIANQVAFFLTLSIDTFLKTSPFLEMEEK